jgi:uncharacterized YccA/Bax inhibitor family protein
MKFVFKTKSKTPTPKLTKVLVGLCIGMGVALTLSCATDNEFALFLSGGISAIISSLALA